MNQIYAYTTETYKNHRGWLKVGQTQQESAEVRVEQQDGTSCPERLTIENTWNVPNGITDKAIHKRLISMGCKEVRLDKGREWFKCTVEDVSRAINDLQFGVARPNSFPPREEQADCVRKAVGFFKSGGTEFLVNAKMRFGKTFTSYLIAKELKAKSILILTYKPAVKSAWQEDLDNHVFFDGWAYSSGNGFEISKKANVNVIFASFQDINDFGKSKWKGITKHHFDLVVIDEMHYGSDTARAKMTLKALSFERTLFVSGTPLDAIISGRFGEDNTYTWSYADEQRKRRAEEQSGWKTKEYRWLPPMEIHTFSVDEEAKRACLAYTKEEQFTMTKMFGSENGVVFNDEPTVKLFLDQVFGRRGKKTQSPIRTCAADHMLFVMPPNVNSVNAMCNLLTKMLGEEYYIINVAGDNISSLDKVKRFISHYSKTITVTCGRFNTGVTVPEWDVVMMMNEGKAPETYFQTIFRVQSPDKARSKEKCYVMDFNPERMLELVYSYAELTAKKNQSITQAVREFLEFAPVIDHSANKLEIVDTEKVVSFVAENGSYIDKFTSSYLFDRTKAADFAELLKLSGGVNLAKVDHKIATNDLEKGKNYAALAKAIKNAPNPKAVEDILIAKAKLITKMIPEYVVFIDPTDSLEQLMKTSTKLFKEHFGVDRALFVDMINGKFLNADRLNRLIAGLEKF